jgi:hypothetical protein
MTKPTLILSDAGNLFIRYPEGDDVEVGSMHDIDVEFNMPAWALDQFRKLEVGWHREHPEITAERQAEIYRERQYDASENR